MPPQGYSRFSKRILAKVIDLFMMGMIALIVPTFLGPVLGFFYSIACDGIHYGPDWKGQSIGKRLLGLRVINVLTGQPAQLRDSLVRNLPVGIATFFAIIPFWGWIFLFLVGGPLLALEIYLMLRADRSHRLGDVMADTEVVQPPRVRPAS